MLVRLVRQRHLLGDMVAGSEACPKLGPVVRVVASKAWAAIVHKVGRLVSGSAG